MDTATDVELLCNQFLRLLVLACGRDVAIVVLRAMAAHEHGDPFLQGSHARYTFF